LIESLFKQASTLARLQSGPVAQQLSPLAEALLNEQYPPETVRRYVRVAEKFGRWLCRHRLSVADVDEATLVRYRNGIGRRKNVNLRAAARGLAKILRLLRSQQAADEPALPVASSRRLSQRIRAGHRAVYLGKIDVHPRLD